MISSVSQRCSGSSSFESSQPRFSENRYSWIKLSPNEEEYRARAVESKYGAKTDHTRSCRVLYEAHIRIGRSWGIPTNLLSDDIETLASGQVSTKGKTEGINEGPNPCEKADLVQRVC